MKKDGKCEENWLSRDIATVKKDEKPMPIITFLKDAAVWRRVSRQNWETSRQCEASLLSVEKKEEKDSGSL